MSESFPQLFKSSQEKINTEVGSVIAADVLEIRDDFVVLDGGLKSECFLPVSQFVDQDGGVSIKPGDNVQVVLDAFEDGHGASKVSYEKALLAEAWVKVVEAYNDDQILKGYVSKRIRGGLQVMIDNTISAFLPGSLADLGFVRDHSFLENTEIDFKIIKLDPEKENVVVSRRAALETIHGVSCEKTLAKINEGDVVEGIVKNFTDYGAFVNIGGIDGLLHITDISWERNAKPTDILSPGQKINVKILAIDTEKNRISLGYKQLQENPWLKAVEKIEVGQKTTGAVTSVTEFGCFVEILPGCEGLVHITEMDWKKKTPSPSKLVSVGDKVQVQILGIDKERLRVSLGMRQCQENPWEKFANSHQPGDRVKGVLRSTTDFGAFIELEHGINGLLHANDLSWTRPVQESFIEFLAEHKKGEEIEVIVMEMHPQNQKIYLAYKEIPDTPYKAFFAEHPKDSVIRAPIISIGKFHAQVKLTETIKGFVHSSELREETVRSVYPDISEGDEIDFQVDDLDRKTKMVRLHLKRLLEKETRKALHEMKAGKTAGGASLGEIAFTREVDTADDSSVNQTEDPIAEQQTTESDNSSALPSRDEGDNIETRKSAPDDTATAPLGPIAAKDTEAKPPEEK